MEQTTKETSDSTHEAKSNERLIEIFEKEIEREIAEKMVAITEISKNIRKCQQNLDRLRKEAVTKFYMDSNKKQESVEQHSIHPAVKRLIGKRPITESETVQFMKNNMTEWRKETRRKRRLSHNSHRSKRKANATDTNVTDSGSENQVKPCYVPPVIPGNPQENSSSRGNTKKMHMRVLVGNVAKQVESEGKGSATHKWMVYVRSAPGSLSLDEQITKVCFYLHPSYKPHDVITILSPPFTLNRRGWGEFPLRVQLFFKNPLNKTADIIHNLKLNGARSGFHTRSAETFADLWINPHQDIRSVPASSKGNSQEILWLASNMLKEEVPDFTSEVMCHKCLITSTSSEVYKCTCDLAHQLEDNGDTVVDQTNIDTESTDSDSSESDDSESDLKYLGSIDPLESAKNLQTEEFTIQPSTSTIVSPESSEKEDTSSKCKTEFDTNSPSQVAASGNLPEEKLTSQTLMTSTTTSEINENPEIEMESDPDMAIENLKKLPKKAHANQAMTTTNTVSESYKFQEIKQEMKTEFDHSSLLKHARHLSEETLMTSNFTSERKQYQEIKTEFDSSLSHSNSISASYLELSEEIQPKYGDIEILLNHHTSGKTGAVNIKQETIHNGFNEDLYLTNQFLEGQPDLLDLNVEPSDLFDDLEIKEDILEEMQKDITKELGGEALLLDLVSENFIEWCSEGSSINTNQKECLDQQMNSEMKEYLETKPTSNHESSINKFIVDDSKSETNTFLACQTIAQESQVIEEIPINMFIDNIVEEEVIIDESISTTKPDDTSSLVVQKYIVSSVVADVCNDVIPIPSTANVSKEALNFDIIEEEIIVDETVNTKINDKGKFVEQKEVVNPVVATSSKKLVSTPTLPKLDLQNSHVTKLKSSTSTNASKHVQNINVNITEKEVIVDKTINRKIKETGKIKEQKDIISTMCNKLVSTPALSQQKNNITTFKPSSSTNPSKVVQRFNLLPCSKESKNTQVNALNSCVNDFNENRKVELITYEDSVNFLRSVRTKTPSLGQSLVKNALNSCVLTTSNYNAKSILVTRKGSQSILKPNVKNPNSLLKSNHTRLSSINGTLVHIPSISKSLVQESKLTQNVVKKAITPNLQFSNARNGSNSRPSFSVNPKGQQPGSLKPNVQITQNKDTKTLPTVSKQCIVGATPPRLQSPISRLSQNPSPIIKKLGLQSGNVNSVRNVGGQITKHLPQRMSVGFQSTTVNPATTNVQNCNVVSTPLISQVSNPSPFMMKTTLSPLTTKTPSNVQKTIIVQHNKCPSNQKPLSIQSIKTLNTCVQNQSQTLVPNGFANRSSRGVINQPEVSNHDRLQKHANGSLELKKPTIKPLVEQSSRKPMLSQRGPHFRESNLNHEEILSMNELRKVLRLPELNIPVDNEESKTDYKQYVFTSNSFHNDLKHVRPFFDVKSKCVISYKDGMSSLSNEQYLFYLYQLSMLVNSCKFTEPELAVRWLIRGMPLVHPDARLLSFKSLHPYCALSADLYRSWPRAKQVANEWLRAKTIEKLMKALRAKGVGLKHIWTTSTIYRWSENHGYSPAFQPCGADSDSSYNESIVCLSKKTHPSNVMQWMDSVLRRPGLSEELIDVVGDGDDKGSAGSEGSRLSPTPVDCGRGVICGKPWVRDMDAYVRQQVQGRLALEQLTPGDTPQPLAATVLSHLAVNFMEDLTRRATAVCNSRKGATVLPGDVSQAILQRPEFDVFSQNGLQIDSKVNEFLNKYKSCHS